MVDAKSMSTSNKTRICDENKTTATKEISVERFRSRDTMCANRCDRISLCIAIFYMGGAKMRQANKHIFIRQLANRHARDIHFTNQLHTSLMRDVATFVCVCMAVRAHCAFLHYVLFHTFIN